MGKGSFLKLETSSHVCRGCGKSPSRSKTQRVNRLLKNSAFGAQPLKGHLNSKNLRHRWNDALIRTLVLLTIESAVYTLFGAVCTKLSDLEQTWLWSGRIPALSRRNG